jgi:hypothetical protein
MINKKSLLLRYVGALVLSAILVVSSPVIYTAYAKDVEFFSENDILFYDPDTCSVTNQGGDTAIEGNDNAEKIFRFLTTTKFSQFDNKPFNAIQAAGALGNFFQESRLNPKAIEGNGEGHGLAQWSYDRKTKLFSLAQSEGKSWSDLSLQFKMMKNEIGGAYYGQKLLTSTFVIGSKAIKFTEVTEPTQASYIFQNIYEGAGTPAQEVRDNAAEGYYRDFKDLAPSSSDATSDSSCGGNTGEASDFAKDGFTIYNQFDPRWAEKPYRGNGGSSTIGDAGCGPSSMAMIITALTGKTVTPADTVAYANEQNDIYVPGDGSDHKVSRVLAAKWGLKAKNIDSSVTAVNTVLKEGGLVITSGSGATPFTSGGHFITIRGVAPSGKWMIGDSNGQVGIKNSDKEWDPQYILDIANKGNIVAITK